MKEDLMGYIEGTHRGQTTFWALEDMVDGQSMVRVIDRFIEVLDLRKLGFDRTEPKGTGRPGYSADVLAKLLVYGYENGIRSSRKLERECRRNVEVMWLVQNRIPDHKTIAEFRKQNIRPLQKLFKEFTGLCRSWELIGGECFAVDGTKIKASNNKKNNFSKKKLEDRIARIDEKIAEWFELANKEDSLEDESTELPQGLLEFLEGGELHAECPENESNELPKELLKLLERRELYAECLEEIEISGVGEVSLVDPDARLMGNSKNGVDVAFNVQSTVDAKHHVIADFDVSLNPSDQGQLDNMSKRLIRQGYRRFGVLGDKGYYNGTDLEKCEKRNIKAVVARQAPSGPKGQAKEFRIDQFTYDKKTDTYLCPAGKTLASKSKKESKRRKYFNRSACANCPHVLECIGGEGRFRTITRGKHADAYDRADQVFSDNRELYKKRQQIVEHPFATIKHFMGGGHFLLRTRRKVRVEVALFCLGYNLKRALKVLGFQELMARLDASLASPLCSFLRFLTSRGKNYSISEA